MLEKMEKEYNFISENTTDMIYLHDCDCNAMCYQNHCLIFEMEWMEVLAEHPLNPNSKAHQSGEGKIILFEPQLVECALYENKKLNGELPEQKIVNIEELNFKDMEFLEYTEEKMEDGYLAKMYLIFNNRTAYHSIAIELKFKKSIVMWDELTEESWFEAEMWR